MYYKGFYLDHQNPEKPVQKSDEYTETNRI